MRAWPFVVLAVALPAALTRGWATLATALALSVLAVWLVMRSMGRPDVAVLAAAVPLPLLVSPIDALLPGLLLATAISYTYLGHQAILLLVAPLTLLLPAPASTVGPPVLAAGLVAASRGRMLWLAGLLALLPLAVADPTLVILLAAAALTVGLVVRVMTASPANRVMARRTAALGLVAMVTPAGLGFVYAAGVSIESFWPAARVGLFALLAGLVLGAAHVGMAAMMVTQSQPALMVTFAWASPLLLVVQGLRAGLTETLGPLYSVLAVTAPVTALGVAALVDRGGQVHVPRPG